MIADSYKNAVKFTVQGVARPQGSKNAYRRGGRIMLVESCKTLPAWRKSVSWYAQQAMQGREMFTGAVLLYARFHFQRPKSHYTKKRNLRKGIRRRMTARPDLSKLVRAIEDSMTKIVYKDDSQITDVRASKHYIDTESYVIIEVHPIEVESEETK